MAVEFAQSGSHFIEQKHSVNAQMGLVQSFAAPTDGVPVDVVEAGEEVLPPHHRLVLGKPKEVLQDPRLVDPS